MTVPNRRPPRPHSCSKSRSPLRQRAAAKPSQVMKPNSSTKMLSAAQFKFGTTLPCFGSAGFYIRRFLRRKALAIVGREIDHRGEYRTRNNPQELKPIEERH